MELPGYLLDPLVEHMGAVEADRIFWMCQAATVPHLKNYDRASFLDDLRVMRWGLYPPPPPPPPPDKDQPKDPEAAKAYFESMGVKVD